jgi:hypothetical protein
VGADTANRTAPNGRAALRIPEEAAIGKNFLPGIRQMAREAAERSAVAQGLPARVTDRKTLERIANVLRGEA